MTLHQQVTLTQLVAMPDLHRVNIRHETGGVYVSAESGTKAAIDRAAGLLESEVTERGGVYLTTKMITK